MFGDLKFRAAAAAILLTAMLLPAASLAETRKPYVASLHELAPSTSRSVLAPAQTVVNISLAAPLNTNSSQIGEPVTATVKEPVYIGPFLAMPEGSELHGIIADLNKTRRENGPNPYIVVEFNSLSLPDSDHSLPFNGELIAYKTGLKRQDYIWRLPQKGDKMKKRLGSMLEGAGYGALINPLFGPVVGAGVGLLKSVAIDKLTEKASVRINAKDIIPISVQQDFELPVQRPATLAAQGEDDLPFEDNMIK